MPQLHPLAQAFLSGQSEQERLNFNRRKQTEEERARAEDEKFRQDQANAVSQRFDKEMELRSKQEEMERQRFEFEKKRHLDAIKDKLVGQILRKERNYNQWSPEAIQQEGQSTDPTKTIAPDIYYDPQMGISINRSEVGTPQAVGQAALEMKKPAMDYEFGQQSRILDQRNSAAQALEEIRARARAKIEEDRRKFQAGENEKNRANRLTAAGISASAATMRSLNRPLSADDVLKIPGAKLGMTMGDVVGMTPQKPLDATDQTRYNTLQSLMRAASELDALYEKVGKKAHTGYMTGNLVAAKDALFNSASEDLTKYRELVGKVFSSGALETAGKTLTKNEEQRVKRWALDLSNNPTQARSRINSMLEQIPLMMKDILTQPSQAGGTLPPTKKVGNKTFVLNPATGRYKEQ